MLLHLQDYPIQRPAGVKGRQGSPVQSNMLSGPPSLRHLPPLVKGPRIPGMSNARLYSHPRKGMRARGMMDMGCAAPRHAIIYTCTRQGPLSLVMKVECQYKSSHGGYRYRSNSSNSNSVCFNLAQSTSKQCWNYKTTCEGQEPSRNRVLSYRPRQATQPSGIGSLESILKSFKFGLRLYFMQKRIPRLKEDLLQILLGG